MTNRIPWPELGLANYLLRRSRSAALPPLPFHNVAENVRYDVKQLSAFY